LSPRNARLPPGLDEPVFEQPWQAQAFAMTVHLHDRGLFSWGEWAEELGRQVKSGDPYYDCWLRALEVMLARKSAASPDEIEETAATWMRAAHATPHGQPVVLENDPSFRSNS
jgi:nitrile hydratase accessory protein